MLRKWIPIAFLALFLGGCTAVASKVISVVARPVLGLAVEDAQTTLAWVEQAAAAGNLEEMEADLARRCPQAVLALDALRRELEATNEEGEGFKGLIYYGTRNRFSQGSQARAMLYLQNLASSCVPLIPAEKLIRVF